MLDLYAGSGALGLEALSRGAESADFVDVAPAASRRSGKTGDAGCTGSHADHRGEALRYAQKLEARSFDIAFADPPYISGWRPRLAAQWLRVPFANTLGIEHDSHEAMPEGGERGPMAQGCDVVSRDITTANCSLKRD